MRDSLAYVPELGHLDWNYPSLGHFVCSLEQGRLSCGTTWHAAGLVGQLRAQESMTRLMKYSTELYAGLEAETGLATGWKECGSIQVARTPERMQYIKRSIASAREVEDR